MGAILFLGHGSGGRRNVALQHSLQEYRLTPNITLPMILQRTHAENAWLVVKFYSLRLRHIKMDWFLPDSAKNPSVPQSA